MKKIKYQIAIVGSQYLTVEMADGLYFYLFDFNESNLKEYPPQLLTEESIKENFGYEFEFFDEISNKEYSSLDVIFREVELNF